MQKKKSKILEIHSQIGESCVVDGDLTSNDHIKIDGRIGGSVSTRGDIVIGDLGYIGGSLMGDHIYIEGEVTGNVTARSHVALRKTAKIGGDITTDTFAAEEGAVYHSLKTTTQEELPEQKPIAKTEKPINSPPPVSKTISESELKGAAKPDEKTQIDKISEKISVKKAVSESNLSGQEPGKSRYKSEEEEKEAFLKTFYFNPDKE